MKFCYLGHIGVLFGYVILRYALWISISPIPIAMKFNWLSMCFVFHTASGEIIRSTWWTNDVVYHSTKKLPHV